MSSASSIMRMSPGSISRSQYNVQWTSRVSEVAHLQPFFPLTILFSLPSENYEVALKKEIFDCFRFMKINSIEEINNLTIRERKFFIELHNRGAEEKKANLNKKPGMVDVDPNSWMDAM